MGRIMFLDQIKQLVDSHKIISFDIFDTLLLRPYLRPSDLFLQLEQLQKIPFWAKRRQEAERAARKKYSHLQDITFEEIYHELIGADKSLKSEELALERCALQPNEEMLAVFNYAKEHGKRILIISDMYLPSDFLSKTLQEKGYQGFEKLYVSNEKRKLKATSDLYVEVARELQINPQDVLHIGDNKHSDVKAAQKAGWHAVHYESVIKQYFKTHRREYKFWKEYPGYEASILLGTEIIRWQKERFLQSPQPYFYRMGYQIGGPVAYGFARWIEQQAQYNHTPNVLFAARDGYTLQRVFETFSNKNIKTGYVYALRFINRICRLDYHKDSLDQVLAVLVYFKQKSARLAQLLPVLPKTAAEGHQFIQEHLDIIRPLAQQEFEHYCKYVLQHIKNPGDVGIVDSVTFSFSSQKLIAAVLKERNVVGYYWSVVSSATAQAYRFEHFLPCTNRIEDKGVFTTHWDFMEFLFTAPEPPIKNITQQGAPVYGETVPSEEKLRIEAYGKVSAGMTDFAKDCAFIFGGRNLFFSSPFLVKWLNWFLVHPTSEDVTEMAFIWHASDTNHSKYIPLLSYSPALYNGSGSYIHLVKRTYWKNCWQTLLVCLLSPISFKKRGSTRALFILPRLAKSWGKLILEVGNHTFYVGLGHKDL